MDALNTNLKCQITSLETQLIYANQENQKLRDTVVCLSKILSDGNQNVTSDQRYVKTGVAAPGNAGNDSVTNITRMLQTAPYVDPNPALETSHRSQPTIIIGKQGKGSYVRCS